MTKHNNREGRRYERRHSGRWETWLGVL